ncbi:NADPH-dependent FMN reductase [Rhodobacterales bacterium HKCCE3408]|nr:NADPH-dependent FMN reductase [Rhodobacterales bacterium HKCCE3408]
MSSGRLLGLCGSLRAASYNRKLMLEGVRLFDPAEFVDGNLRLPLYDGDLEKEGIPDEVQQLSDEIKAADAVWICGPEYNKNISGVLKNALDWISRTKGGPWRDKPVAIASATAGRAGGERTQNSLVLCLRPFRPRLIAGPEVLVGDNSNQFDVDGTLTNERNLTALKELMEALRAEAGLG